MLQIYRFEDFQVYIEDNALHTKFAKAILQCAPMALAISDVLDYSTTIVVQNNPKQWDYMLSQKGRTPPFSIVRTDTLVLEKVLSNDRLAEYQPDAVLTCAEDVAKELRRSRTYSRVLTYVNAWQKNLFELRYLSDSFIQIELEEWVDSLTQDDRNTIFKAEPLVGQLFELEAHGSLAKMLKQGEPTLTITLSGDIKLRINAQNENAVTRLALMNDFVFKWAPVLSELSCIDEIPIKTTKRKRFSLSERYQDRKLHLYHGEAVKICYALLNHYRIKANVSLYMSIVGYILSVELDSTAGANNKEGSRRLRLFIELDDNQTHLWKNIIQANAFSQASMLMKVALIFPDDELSARVYSNSPVPRHLKVSAITLPELSIELYELCMRFLAFSSELNILVVSNEELIQKKRSILPELMWQLHSQCSRKGLDAAVENTVLKINHFIERVKYSGRALVSASVVLEVEQIANTLIRTHDQYRSMLLNLIQTLTSLTPWVHVVDQTLMVQRARIASVLELNASGYGKDANLLMSIYLNSNPNTSADFRFNVPQSNSIPLALEMAFGSIFSQAAKLKLYVDRVSTRRALIGAYAGIHRALSPEPTPPNEMLDILTGMNRSTSAFDDGQNDEFRFSPPPPIEFYDQAKQKIRESADKKTTSLLNTYRRLFDERDEFEAELELELELEGSSKQRPSQEERRYLSR